MLMDFPSLDAESTEGIFVLIFVPSFLFYVMTISQLFWSLSDNFLAVGSQTRKILRPLTKQLQEYVTFSILIEELFGER